MKEMSPEDKQRIEKAANEWFRGWRLKKGVEIPLGKEGYIEGATRENERMAELLKEQIELVSTREAEQDVMAADTVRLMDQIEYQKKALKEDYDKITKLEFGLKEERNKAIDECILDLKAIISPVAFITVKDRLETLKGKSQ